MNSAGGPNMRFRFGAGRLMCRVATIAAALTVGSIVATAQTSICNLLAPTDVAALLGTAQAGKPGASGATCVWGDMGAVGGKTGLMIQAPALDASAEAAFKANRDRAFKNTPAQTQDEPGIGDQAFSQLTSYGAQINVLKKGRVLQLQYSTSKRGTDTDRAALRGVAKKAVAPF
jgi:hypothetical protein